MEQKKIYIYKKPTVSSAASPPGELRTNGNPRACNCHVHKSMICTVAGPAQQLLQARVLEPFLLIASVSLSPCPVRCSLLCAGWLPSAAATGLKGDAFPAPAAWRGGDQSGSEGDDMKKVQVFFLLFCFLPIDASSSSDQGFISKWEG